MSERATSQTTGYRASADTLWASQLLDALCRRDDLDYTIREYARLGISHTQHAIEHRDMRDDVCNQIIALWNGKPEAESAESG